jgi:hypothetical protein
VGSRKLLMRLISRRNVVEGCWIWEGADSGNGYGRISVNGKTRAVHIVSYEFFTGQKVPKGMVLDHKCNNRMCYNPKCLKPIPGVVNTLIGEGPTAKNALKTHCIRGHELSGENLITRVRNGRPTRECRECRRIRARKIL